MKKTIIVLFVSLIASNKALAQYDSSEPNFKPCFVGSTMFMLGNLLPENTPDFIQLNLGYRLTDKDVVSLELKTWRYFWSLGIQYGEFYEDPDYKFPGYIREKGFAIAYQHYWWKGFYTGIHVMSAWQSFIDENENKIDDGYQIFNTYRLGYHFKLFNDRFFIEPSLAITHRFYHTQMPESFRVKDERWSKFFFGEPGLHFGFNF